MRPVPVDSPLAMPKHARPSIQVATPVTTPRARSPKSESTDLGSSTADSPVNEPPVTKARMGESPLVRPPPATKAKASAPVTPQAATYPIAGPPIATQSASKAAGSSALASLPMPASWRGGPAQPTPARPASSQLEPLHAQLSPAQLPIPAPTPIQPPAPLSQPPTIAGASGPPQPQDPLPKAAPTELPPLEVAVCQPCGQGSGVGDGLPEVNPGNGVDDALSENLPDNEGPGSEVRLGLPASRAVNPGSGVLVAIPEAGPGGPGRGVLAALPSVGVPRAWYM